MAELTQKEQLQPSLLDRLTDNEPDKQAESRDKRVLSLKKLRDCVLRDLGWLMNTGNLESLLDLEKYPEVVGSVVNYGLSDMAGKTVKTIDPLDLERSVKRIICDFEPRILKNSVKVQIATSDEQMNGNALTFLIEGDLWAQPMPQRLFLKTVIDLDTGSVDVQDYGG